MELISIIAGLLKVADLVVSLKDKLSLKDEEKAALSDIVINIGNLINLVSEDLEKNIYPHNKCGQMIMYSEQLKSVLWSKISADEFSMLNQNLQGAIAVEQLLGGLNLLTPESKTANINELKTISGKFIAFGDILKVK